VADAGQEGSVLDMEAMVHKLLILQNFRRRISTSGTPPFFLRVPFMVVIQD